MYCNINTRIPALWSTTKQIFWPDFVLCPAVIISSGAVPLPPEIPLLWHTPTNTSMHTQTHKHKYKNTNTHKHALARAHRPSLPGATPTCASVGHTWTRSTRTFAMDSSCSNSWSSFRGRKSHRPRKARCVFTRSRTSRRPWNSSRRRESD